jgi:hypothetical protein
MTTQPRLFDSAISASEKTRILGDRLAFRWRINLFGPLMPMAFRFISD